MRKLTVTMVATSVALALACGGGAGGDKKDKTAKVEAKKDAKAKDAKDKDAKKDEGAKKDAAGGDIVAQMTAAMKAFNEGKYDETLAAFTDDAQWAIVGGPPPVKGKEAIKKAWEENRTAFPDLKIAPSRIVLADNFVFVQGGSNATHKGDFMGTAATDKPVGVEHLQVAELRDGKIASLTLYENMPNLLAQIGAAPEGSPPALPPPTLASGAPEVIKGEANQANLDVLKKWYGSFDWEVCEKEVCAEGVVHHDIAEGKTVKTPEEHKEGIDKFKKAFPDMKIEIKQAISAGDWVAVASTASGTHKGDMGPIKATGKPVSIDYAEIIKFENGKIKESWGYMNPGQLMAQLGLAPPPGDAKVAQK